MWLVVCCWVATKKHPQWFGSTMQDPGQRVGWNFGRVGLSWPLAFWIPGHGWPAVFGFSGIGDPILRWWFQLSGARFIHEQLKCAQHAMWIVFPSWSVSTQSLRWCAQLSLRVIAGVVWILGRAGLFWPLAFWTPGHSPFWVFGLCGRCCRLLSLREPFSSAWYNHEVLKCVQCALWMVFTWWTVSKRCLMWCAQRLLQGKVGGWTLAFSTKRQVPGSSVSVSTCAVFRRWFLLFALCNLLRVGEALHPGPAVATSWTLGIANPSGLNGKLDQVNHMSGDVWILSETHLSQRGLTAFKKGLNMLGSTWKYAVPGAPCQPRQHTDTGVHSGVLMVSKYPARPLPHVFDAQVYSSARVQVVGVSLADTWVTVGMLYGYPCNASRKQARYQTDAMLADLVDRVGCQASGPRAIGGDFNFGPEELEQLSRLHMLGFREVQDLRAWRTGQSVEATGRGSKRIDQLWISPELQRVLVSVQVEFDHWADHAAVMATFSHEGLVGHVDSWPAPSQFPWPKEWTCQVEPPGSGDLSLAYAQFWNQVETQAKCWVRHQGVPVLKG